MPAAKVPVVLVINIGWQDADRLGLHDLTAEELMEGKTVQVAEAIAKEMIAHKWAMEPAEYKKALAEAKKKTPPPTPTQLPAPPTTTTATDDTDVEDEPEPDQESEEEAIDRISRMRSPEKLKEIIEGDPRPEVVEAAEIRLEELKG